MNAGSVDRVAVGVAVDGVDRTGLRVGRVVQVVGVVRDGVRARVAGPLRVLAVGRHTRVGDLENVGRLATVIEGQEPIGGDVTGVVGRVVVPVRTSVELTGGEEQVGEDGPGAGDDLDAGQLAGRVGREPEVQRVQVGSGDGTDGRVDLGHDVGRGVGSRESHAVLVGPVDLDHEVAPGDDVDGVSGALDSTGGRGGRDGEGVGVREGGVTDAVALGDEPGLQDIADEFQRQQYGRTLFNSGNFMPIGIEYIQETTVFREYGPLAGNTVRIGYEYAPSFGEFLSRQTAEVDARYYKRIATNGVLAFRARGYKSWGEFPGYLYFGGNSELRGYDYLEFLGNKAFFANAELRFPIIEAALTLADHRLYDAKHSDGVYDRARMVHDKTKVEVTYLVE